MKRQICRQNQNFLSSDSKEEFYAEDNDINCSLDLCYNNIAQQYEHQRAIKYKTNVH